MGLRGRQEDGRVELKKKKPPKRKVGRTGEKVE